MSRLEPVISFAASKVKTEVHLEKQKGSWRIVDETLQIRPGE